MNMLTSMTTEVIGTPERTGREQQQDATDNGIPYLKVELPKSPERMKEKKLQDSDKKTNKVTVELANGPTQSQGGDGGGGIIKL